MNAGRIRFCSFSLEVLAVRVLVDHWLTAIHSHHHLFLSAHSYHLFIWIYDPFATRLLEGLEGGRSRWDQRFDLPCKTCVSHYPPKIAHSHTYASVYILTGDEQNTHRQPHNSDIKYEECSKD